jgi:acyl dehydratase
VTRVFSNLTELKAAVGTDLGHSGWLEIDQARIDRFAEATGDFQWIHVDAERANDGPYGRTIAQGYLTLSLWPILFREMVQVNAVAMAVNCGTEKLRFPAPVPVGSKIRLGVTIAAVDDVPGGVQCTYRFVLETANADKPACVVTALIRYFATPGGWKSLGIDASKSEALISEP